MNLFSFLDAKFQITSQELSKDFSPYKDGKTKAIHSIINWMRFLGKWGSVPLILGEFVLVKCKLLPAPESPLKKDLKTIEAKKEVVAQT
jgi:hypothetical protein